MDAGVLGVMIPLFAVVGAYVMAIYLRKYQHAERLAMIEKGVGADLFDSLRPRSTALPLRASLLLIGGGVGLLLGYTLDAQFNMEKVGYFAMLFICGGIGLGAAYLIEEKKIKEERGRLS